MAIVLFRINSLKYRDKIIIAMRHVMSHIYQDLITVFNQQFATSENTQLVKGEDEPIYLPADQIIGHHRIIFAHGFYASALHEISHWCIAGEKRRKLVDFGYWYAPDGRDAMQQAEFEKVEVKPQAIEWAFCVAAGFAFNVSADNLNGVETDRFAFQAKVKKQVSAYLHHGFPPRAQQFIDALIAFYQPGLTLKDSLFNSKEPMVLT